MSWYHKGKTSLDFTEARDSEWHQLGHIPYQHPTTQFFTGRMPLLPPNQQCHSTKGTVKPITTTAKTTCLMAFIQDNQVNTELEKKFIYPHPLSVVIIQR